MGENGEGDAGEGPWSVPRAVPDDEALKAAAAPSKRDDDVSSIEAEPNVIQWTTGFVLAFQAAIFTEPFMH